MPSLSLSHGFPRLLLPVIWSVLVLAMWRSPSEAGQRTFVVASDGYGIDDCLATNTSCGRMVAEAWCSAHGMAKALAFGSAGDLTASIPGKPEAAASGSMLITCSN